jgi:hypothetical protein
MPNWKEDVESQLEQAKITMGLAPGKPGAGMAAMIQKAQVQVLIALVHVLVEAVVRLGWIHNMLRGQR